MPFLRRLLTPAMPAPHRAEVLRAALGVAVALVLCDLALWAITVGAGASAGLSHLTVIAPFSASAFLIFVVPNSPLAQPFSVVVGNTLAALAAMLALHVTTTPLLAMPLAVALTVIGAAALRAYHPPAGAVALSVVIAASGPHPPVWGFAFFPVAIGSALLVAVGIVWNRATGRVYPFRQSAPAPHGTTDPVPDRRLGLTRAELAGVLDRLRMAPIIGVEDLARVLSAAEAEAASQHLGHLTAADIMSRDLTTVAPDTPLPDLARAFRAHRFKTLPVTQGGLYLGLIDQSALLGLTDPTIRAADLIGPAGIATPQTDAARLIDLLADGGQQAVPVLQDGHLVGLVTRSDLIALLSAHLRAS